MGQDSINTIEQNQNTPQINNDQSEGHLNQILKFFWKDLIAGLFAILGIVVVIARLESYSWWLIGSWKGAVGVLAVIGLAILLTHITELIKFSDVFSFSEALVWVTVITSIVASLIIKTNRADFIIVAILLALAWIVQLSHHLWEYTTPHRTHYMFSS